MSQRQKTFDYLVFTDLDGTLLDHHNYSFAPAVTTLRLLAEQQVPVIPVTSKTRAELLPLRAQLQNEHPFVTENGAAVFIPKGYFPLCPQGCEEAEAFWVKPFSRSVEIWQPLLQRLKTEFKDEFVLLSELTVEQLVQLTGLNPEQARLAQQREYSEPVHWLGDEKRRVTFIEALAAEGIEPLQGGRFLHLVDQCDKGKALQWLTRCYQAYQPKHPLLTVAAGDSQNDIAMLQAADRALLVRSPVHAPPQLFSSTPFILSEHCGPAGWAAGIRQLLSLSAD
ncbi:HAD-IIB family hydrolase [Neptuniibacter sp. CAU 1671]|uniref:HAD-IIB family hydrolase n=1 Tax=Neptuniibacter sp. CAU 1671 TaxID=3032593 RepID=UPI0023DC71B5|nr:HAD-IIB family hydrolase [Neptuniibacter sp. CAU 1671]MDF2182465.1 HAD-IIB family hydrolase [Neptuniibacter sp. CAU 1671]